MEVKTFNDWCKAGMFSTMDAIFVETDTKNGGYTYRGFITKKDVEDLTKVANDVGYKILQSYLSLPDDHPSKN